MLNKIVSKALEPYSRAFLIAKIWGEVPTCELAKYRKKIFDRFKKHNWTVSFFILIISLLPF